MADFSSEDSKTPGSVPLTGLPVPPEPPMSPMDSSQSAGASLVDSLINQTQPLQSDPLENKNISNVQPATVENPPKPKKHSSFGIMLAGILVLMVTLPIGIYFISQQNTRLTEQRSCAAGETGCTPPEGIYPSMTVPPDFECHEFGCCQHYKNKTCNWNESTKVCTCTTYGECEGEWGGCHNDTCHCIQEKYCKDTDEYQIRGCSGCGGCNETPTDSPNNPTEPPRNTPTTAPGQCSDIKVYKDNVRVDLATVKHGDVIELAVTGSQATKARIRVNSGGWTVTDVKNGNGEYRISFTVPNEITTFTVEAEIFDSTTSLWK
jgi:hypothetical protein